MTSHRKIHVLKQEGLPLLKAYEFFKINCLLFLYQRCSVFIIDGPMVSNSWCGFVVSGLRFSELLYSLEFVVYHYIYPPVIRVALFVGHVLPYHLAFPNAHFYIFSIDTIFYQVFLDVFRTLHGQVFVILLRSQEIGVTNDHNRASCYDLIVVYQQVNLLFSILVECSYIQVEVQTKCVQQPLG